MVRARLALLAVLISAWLPSAVPAATKIVIRHAERSSGMSADASLSPAGDERARQLSQVLKDAKRRGGAAGGGGTYYSKDERKIPNEIPSSGSEEDDSGRRPGADSGSRYSGFSAGL